MADFFEKLKKGMGIEDITEEAEEEEIKEKKEIQEQKREEKPAKSKKTIQVKKMEAKPKPTAIKKEEEETEAEKIEIPAEKETPLAGALEEEKKWPEPEGQLAIDVYQTETELVIQSAIAGVKPEDLDISLEKDILAIKGSRQKPFEENGDYFTQECYWGPFSREVILPVEFDPDRVEAAMKDGILTIRIPKLLREKKRNIKVRI